MGQICWDFPLLGSGNESGSNIAAITLFNVGAGVMDSLAREVCQNSLDAKNKILPSDVPVRVKFELQYKTHLPGFRQVRLLIFSLPGVWIAPGSAADRK